MISDGWIRATPMLSQRWAPLDVSPNTATATSSSTPTRYTGSAIARTRWIGSRAATHITTTATAELIICDSIRAGEALAISVKA